MENRTRTTDLVTAASVAYFLCNCDIGGGVLDTRKVSRADVLGAIESQLATLGGGVGGPIIFDTGDYIDYDKPNNLFRFFIGNDLKFFIGADRVNIKNNIPFSSYNAAGTGFVNLIYADTNNFVNLGNSTVIAGSLKLNPHQDHIVLPIGNPLTTISSLVCQGAKAFADAREWMAVFGMTSNTGKDAVGQGGENKNTVTLYAGIQGSGNTGAVWALNTVTIMNSGAFASNVHGIEVDMNINNAHYDALGPTSAYGIAITGAGSFRATAALHISGPNTSPIWNYGIIFTNNSCLSVSIFDSIDRGAASGHVSYVIGGRHSFGISTAEAVFDTAAIRLGNNQKVVAYNNVGTPGTAYLELLKLDTSDQLNIGNTVANIQLLKQTTISAISGTTHLALNCIVGGPAPQNTVLGWFTTGTLKASAIWDNTNLGFYIGSDSVGYMVLKTAATDRVYITSAGLVGVGVAAGGTVSGALHIRSASSTVQLFLDNTGGQYTTVYWCNNGALKADAFWDNVAGGFYLGTDFSSTLNLKTNSVVRASWSATGVLSQIGDVVITPSFTTGVTPTGNTVSTKACFSLQTTTTQAAQREFAVNIGLISSTGSGQAPGTAASDKAALYVGTRAMTGTGDAWAANFLLSIEAGGNVRNMVTLEVDHDNFGGTDYTGLSPVAAGLTVSGAGYWVSSTAIEISGAISTTAGGHTVGGPIWVYGLTIANTSVQEVEVLTLTNAQIGVSIRGSKALYGLDTGFMTGSIALRIANAQSIRSRNAANSVDLDILRVDSTNRLIIGKDITTSGIGTNAPSTAVRLHIVGDGSNTLRLDAPNATTYSTLDFANNGTVKSAIWWDQSATAMLLICSAASSSMLFATAGTSRMQITSAGHVIPVTDSASNLGDSTHKWLTISGATAYLSTSLSIGVTSTTYKLGLGTGLGAIKLAIYDAGSTNSYGIGVQVPGTGPEMCFCTNTSGANMSWYSSEAGGLLMHLQGGGNLGIGKVPTCRLHVLGDGSNTLRLDAASGQRYSAIGFANNGSDKAGMWWDHTGTVLVVTATAASSSLILSTNANAGIQLTLNNDLIPLSTGKLGLTGSRWAEIWVTTGAFNTSDLREKEIYGGKVLGLDFILAQKPIAFRLLSDKEGVRRHGLGVQDVISSLCDDEIFSGAVYDEPTDTYGLCYTEFIAPIISSIQTLHNRINRLEGEVYGQGTRQ